MHTRILKASPVSIRAAAAIIRRGGLVAFPTETVYGLGANALDPAAVRAIFRAKRRPPDNPLIIHIASRNELGQLASPVPPAARRLARRFWPGPLTLVLRRRPDIPAEASCGLPTVAVRLPRHPAARALIRAAGVPIAAPSANLAGRPSPTAARHVAYDLAGRIPLILDGGPARVGLESTVVDCTRSPPRLLRPGGVSLEELRRIVPGIRAVRGTAHRPACPGMKYRHYAPAVPLVLGPPAALARLARQEAGKGRAVAVLSSSESARSFPASTDVHIMGSRAEPREWAARLFGTLRTLEKTADIILVEAIPARGLGRAVRDRLRKAASLAP